MDHISAQFPAFFAFAGEITLGLQVEIRHR